jgi:cbb3-type cytochrome oxidase subunit 3
MAAILPILLLILTVPVFYARVFWYYSAAEKAAHDAARFLSSATQAEMRTLGDGGGEARVAAIARWIADTETEALRPVMSPRWIYVQCGTPVGTGGYIDYGNCGNVVPVMVRVYFDMTMYDDIFGEFTAAFYPEDGLRMKTDVTMRYAGN